MAGEMSVSVDRDFARFGNKSYAINKINSVEVRQRHPYGQGAMILWGLLSAICAFSAASQISSRVFLGAFLTLLFAVLFGYLAYRAWLSSKILEYQLFLMTSSSEAQALVSRDVDMITRLRSRIESAMAGQLV